MMPLSVDSEISILSQSALHSLGQHLVGLGFISSAALEAAFEHLEGIPAVANPEHSLLTVLDKHLGVLDESQLIKEAIRRFDVTRLEASNYPSEIILRTPPDICLATWSIPFAHDFEGWCVASAYYLSTEVRSFWEKELGGPIRWYIASTDEIFWAVTSAL